MRRGWHAGRGVGVLFGLGLAMILAAEAAAADPIGVVKTVDGTGHIARGDAEFALATEIDVHLHDEIFTGRDGAVGIGLKDGTVLSLGPDGHIILDELIYDPGRGAVGMRFQFLSGTMQYISGRIAQIAPESVSVDTPVGTLGIRGTRFLLKVSED